MARVLIVSGGREPFVDPWHPYAETSRRLAAIALDRRHVVEVSDDPVGRLIEGLDGVDVLVSNLPDPDDGVSQDQRALVARALDEWASTGVGVLGVHVGMTGLLGWPRWSPLMGARWAGGASGHPPLGLSRIRTLPHRLTDGASEFEVMDERYTGLEVTAGFAAAADHEVDGVIHPLIWSRREGPIRIVVDALGHGVESFDAPEHRAIVGRALDWLAERD